MNPALWGVVTALGWGSADFIARFTGQALGHHRALLGMLAVSAALLTLLAWGFGLTWSWRPDGLWLLLLTGLGAMVATLLLYQGLARGPVSLVAPLVGCYPALNVALAVALGSRPTAVQWAAMAAVMLGVVVVARSARSFETSAGLSRQALRGTMAIALASAACFAVTVALLQPAAALYGELQTVVAVRWIGLAALLLLFAWRRRPLAIAARVWPLLALQGLLDGLGYLTLLLGARGPGAEIAVVVGSAFGAVTVVLARVVLREAVTLPQWGGIAMIAGGVAVLSA